MSSDLVALKVTSLLPAVASSPIPKMLQFSLLGNFFQLQEHQSVESDEDDVGSDAHQDEVEPHAVDLQQDANNGLFGKWLWLSW